MPVDSKFSVDQMDLEDIKIISGRIDSPFEFRTEDISGFKANMDFRIAHNLSGGRLKADLTIQVQTDSNPETNNMEASGEFHFSYIFLINNLSELVKINEDGLAADEHLVNAIAAISYSTARGILLTRFQGTCLSEFLLPIIDPANLLTDKIRSTQN